MKLINSYMDRDFQLSGFLKAANYTDISDDYIDKIVVGDSNDENVLAFSCNSVNNSKWMPIECSYIAKCWKSGMTDLYIYLPTTNTYYIPHIEGAS